VGEEHNEDKAAPCAKRADSVREALIRTRSKYIALIGALARREGCRIKAGPSPSFARRFTESRSCTHAQLFHGD
jgi:hypothetical protein